VSCHFWPRHLPKLYYERDRRKNIKCEASARSDSRRQSVRENGKILFEYRSVGFSSQRPLRARLTIVVIIYNIVRDVRRYFCKRIFAGAIVWCAARPLLPPRTRVTRRPAAAVVARSRWWGGEPREAVWREDSRVSPPSADRRRASYRTRAEAASYHNNDNNIL